MTSCFQARDDRFQRMADGFASARGTRSGFRVPSAVGAALALAVLCAPAARAAGTYYVDALSGNCSAAATGTIANPYCTISAAVAARGGPGTVILVMPGIYREKVTVTASGSATEEFVIRALDSRVEVDGSDDLSAGWKWNLYAGNVWVAPSVTWSPAQVFFDDARLAPSAVAPESLTSGAYVYVPGTGLCLNAGGVNPGTHQTFVGRRTHGFLVSGHPMVRIDGFTIKRSEDVGIEIMGGSDRCTVVNNTVSLSASAGIAAESSAGVMIDSNTVFRNFHHGIRLMLGVTGSTIQDNETYLNTNPPTQVWANGIYLDQCPGNLIQRNRVHHNGDTGVEIQSGSNDNVVLQNLSWSNGDHGFEQLYATGTLNVGNVAFGNHTDGFSIEGHSTGTRIYNCIATDNGLTVGEYDLYMDSTSTAGFDSDYNIFWNSVPGTFPVKYDLLKYTSLAAYVAATGHDVNSTSADPRFVNAANGNFHLLAGSPAIDAAYSGVPSWPATDAEGYPWADDPSVPNTGAGPISYGDRGAFEFIRPAWAGVGGTPGVVAASLSLRSPNPGHGSVSFALQLPRDASVKWAIFDTQGRQVWSENRAVAQGTTELKWIAADRSGTRAATGVYFVRVNTGSGFLTRRFVVL